MLEEIKLRLLPQTFRDAIHITRKLGYQYIWIDSLCILQDDQEDWTHESSTMVGIYSNSVLTIAAVWGRDSDTGCFTEREPLIMQDCRIGDWPGGGIYVESSDSRRHPTFFNTRLFPLYDRAWVLQERLLSPRVLCYGPFQLHWECFECQLDEMSPKANLNGGMGPDLMKNQFKQFEQLRMPTTGDIYKQAICRSIYDICIRIKSRYWTSGLTFESDVLVAFSGITASMEKTTGMTNLYGLWAEFLALELLWSVRLRKCVVSPALPTWSWACRWGSHFSFHKHEIGWFTKDCRVQTSFQLNPHRGSLPENQNSDPARTLRVNGPLMSTVLRPRSRFYHPDKKYHPDEKPLPPLNELLGNKGPSYSPANQLLVPLDVWFDHIIAEDCKVYLLQIVLFKPPLCDPSSVLYDALDYRLTRHTASLGLVLLPVESEPLTFQRVGRWDNTWFHYEGQGPGPVEDNTLKFTSSETFLLV